MIISASRRTDIPAYFSGWFFERLREGYVLARNPMNLRQVSRVSLAPEAVDGIVFWTKNPAPMLSRLGELTGYTYYFQFTLTPYGTEIEPHLPPKREVLSVFRELSGKIGAERVVWRYDPIFLSEKYSAGFHLEAFEKTARLLRGYTASCVISFLDLYRKIAKKMDAFGIRPPSEPEMLLLAGRFSQIASENEMELSACCEAAGLSPFGIRRSKCIDKERLERLSGHFIKAGRDRNQRTNCGCCQSVDIGQYNTCQNGCQYCYANFSEASVQRNFLAHHPSSPLLTGKPADGDRITDRT